MDNKISLLIKTEKLGDIRDVIKYLNALENVYNNFYAFFLIVEDAKHRYKDANGQASFDYRYSKKIKNIRTIRKPDEIVLPEDRLLVESVVIRSPGFWEVIGQLNPLETLRKYLNDRHERKKDLDYRNHNEKEKQELENQKLKTEIVKEQIKILRDIGVSEDRIRVAISKHIIEPLDKIDLVQDKGLIENSEAKSIDKQTHEL